MSEVSATKILSPNDVGLTGTHQAGFLIPKSLIDADLFPRLSQYELNPRRRLKFVVLDDDQVFYANFIYYNNKHFQGTRDEYRLTGIKTLLRGYGLKEGDQIKITKTNLGTYSVETIKARRIPTNLSVESWQLIYGGGK
jgi:Restriction endonuclease EcoRII, N-terminal